MEKIRKTEAEWKAQLTPEQFAVTRSRETEPAFCGTLLHEKREGEFCCVCCGNPLFKSTDKFESNTGWPSFFGPIGTAIEERSDDSHDMHRTEIVCARCDAHLGHVFFDGPPPTGRRYCINSIALEFVPG